MRQEKGAARWGIEDAGTRDAGLVAVAVAALPQALPEAPSGRQPVKYTYYGGVGQKYPRR
jgi:hypothetical protein